VEFAVFDLAGREVRRMVTPTALPAGSHALEWDGRSDAGLPVPVGVYLYRLRAGQVTVTSRITRLR